MCEIADAIIDGELCECGAYIGPGVGYPRSCKCCAKEEKANAHPKIERTNCHVCNKRLKKAGLADHMRVMHPRVVEESAAIKLEEVSTDRDTWKSRAEFSYQERSKLEKRCEELVNKLDQHQKDAAIGRAVNRACMELPFGYDLHIELEKDAGTVRLYRPDGEEDKTDFHDCDYFSSVIENAINVAVAKGGAA